MTENQQSVTMDKRPRSEQEIAASQAAVRALVLGNAVGFAAQSLSPMLTNVLVAEATKYPVENYLQPAPQPVYEQPVSAPKPVAPAEVEPDFSPAATDAYLDAIAPQPADFQQNTGTNWQQAASTDEQTARQEQARQDLASFYGETDAQNSSGMAA